MSTHYVALRSIAHNATESAMIEMTAPNGATFSFTVYDASGTWQANFTVDTNTDRFASTATHTTNLFSLTGYHDGFVVVQSNQAIASAVLRHTTTGINTSVTRLVTIPSSSDSLATALYFPLGSLGGGAWAIVGNPNSAQVTVTLRFGTTTSTVQSTTTIDAHGCAAIALNNNDANVVLTSTANITAQLLITAGSNPFMETFVLA